MTQPATNIPATKREDAPCEATNPLPLTTVAADDELGFEKFYGDIAPLLRVIAGRRFQVPAEDIGGLVNDVFINYLRDPDSVRDARQYLIGATCNACRAYWRRRTAHDRIFQPSDSPCPSADPTLDSLATVMAVGSMLNQLGSTCRDVLRRFYVEDQATSFIAEEMDTTPGAIRVRLHKCRQIARKIFSTITASPRTHAPQR